MTKELKSLTAKELRQYQTAMQTLAKIFDLTDDDIDSFFAFIKNSKEIAEAIKSHEERLESVERSLDGKTMLEAKEKAQKAYDALNRKNEELKVW